MQDSPEDVGLAAPVLDGLGDVLFVAWAAQACPARRVASGDSPFEEAEYLGQVLRGDGYPNPFGQGIRRR